MKRVLLICYYFPPLGGAGINRPLSLYKHLKDFEIECDILTVKPVAYRNYERDILDSLDKKNIYRSGSSDPQRLMYLMGMRTVKDKTISKGKNISDKFFPDSKIGWVKKAVKLGRTLIENKQHDAIISTSPPISAHLVAKKLSKEFKLPWLADFRDYWTSYKPEDWFDDNSQIQKANKLLGEIKEKADIVTCASQGIAGYLKTGETIYNSYSFEIAQLWEQPQNSDKIQIGILGTIDRITPIEPIIDFLNYFIKSKPEWKEKIFLDHVGEIKTDISGSLADFALSDNISFHGLKPRTETIDILNRSSLFLFSLSKEYGEGIITSRIFDIIASNRPLVGFMPEEFEAASISKSLENSFVVSENDFQSGSDRLEELLKKIISNNVALNPGSQSIEQYSENKMVEKFINCLNRIIKKE